MEMRNKPHPPAPSPVERGSKKKRWFRQLFVLGYYILIEQQFDKVTNTFNIAFKVRINDFDGEVIKRFENKELSEKYFESERSCRIMAKKLVELVKEQLREEENEEPF